MAEVTAPTLPRWATDGAALVTEPSEGKKDIGWIGEMPSANAWNWLKLQTYEYLVYLKTRLLASPGLQADTELTIASGSITPTQGNHSVDTEGDAASDDLTNIVTTGLDDGRMLVVRAVNAAHVVTVKHAAGSAGQIHLANGYDLVLNSVAKMLMLKRIGADWYEVGRSYQPDGIVGELKPYGGTTAPNGWLLCDGAAVSRATYAALFAVTGTAFGVGDGSTTFNLPDTREAALVGAGTRGSGVTAHDAFAVGEFKDDQMQGHWHELLVSSSGTAGPNFQPAGAATVNDGYSPDDQVIGAKTDTVNGTPRTGTVTRGKRLGVNHIIKF